uniref:Na_Ca_ex domain-containing protein n=1 Tax=Macrostomum lignano TaxID=282301 RepID=A0A1I8F6Q4_9PLAT
PLPRQPHDVTGPAAADIWRGRLRQLFGVSPTPQPGASLCVQLRRATPSPHLCARWPDWAKPLYLAALRNMAAAPICNSGHYGRQFLLPVAHGSATTSPASPLLAFGNGAPDIFSSLAAVLQSDSGDASLAFGALLGAGVFVTTVVAGVVQWRRPLLKDLVFYLAALYLAFYAIYRGRINLAEAVCFLGLYLAFSSPWFRGSFASYARRRRHGHRRPHPHGAAIGVNSPADQLTGAAAGSYGEAGAPCCTPTLPTSCKGGRVGVSSSGSVGAATVNDGLLYT